MAAMFEHLESYAGDPIFRLGEECHRDPRPRKVNLTVGLYYDDDGRIPLLPTVQTAEKRRAGHPRPRPYLTIEGLAENSQAVHNLVFRPDSKRGSAACVDTIPSEDGAYALIVGDTFHPQSCPTLAMRASNP